MRLVSFKLKGDSSINRIGCVMNEQVLDLQVAHKKMLQTEKVNQVDERLLPADPNTFFTQGISAINKAKVAYNYAVENQLNNALYNMQDVVLTIPISKPGKIICVGKNYADHVVEMKSEIPEYPVLFAKFSNTLIGPEDPIKKSNVTDQLDYEVELVVVIGKEAKSVPRERAFEYIAGYTIGNDTSARDLQKRTPQWLQGKTLDHCTPIGPWIVTKDEIKHPDNLSIKSFVNGQERQSSNTSKLIFSIDELIAFISNLMTLNAGDIIMTGTPDGVGFAMNPPQFLQANDVVALEIEGIGRMENQVIE